MGNRRSVTARLLAGVVVLVVLGLVAWLVYDQVSTPSAPRSSPPPASSPTSAPPAPTPSAKDFNVIHYGADPSGHRDSTVAIRRAIAAAESAGGNQTVYFPAGTYLLNDTTGTKTLGQTRKAKDPNVPIVAELDLDGSHGSVINILGAGENQTKVVEAVGVTNPQYKATLGRGYNAFVFTHMNGFYFSGLTVDSATYTAGDTLEDFGSNTTIENSDFMGSKISNTTTNPDVFGVRVIDVCKAVPSSDHGAAAGYTGSDFHTNNTIRNITVSGGGVGGNSDLGVACQAHDTISNVTDTGWGLALYVDYDVTVDNYTFAPGSNQTGHPGFYITDSSGLNLIDFRTSGEGGTIGGSGGNVTYNTTITNEQMTAPGYSLQLRNATDTTINGSKIDQMMIRSSVGIDGVMVTDSTINGAPSSPTSPASVACNAQSPSEISHLDGVQCASQGASEASGRKGHRAKAS